MNLNDGIIINSGSKISLIGYVNENCEFNESDKHKPLDIVKIEDFFLIYGTEGTYNPLKLEYLFNIPIYNAENIEHHEYYYDDNGKTGKILVLSDIMANIDYDEFVMGDDAYYGNDMMFKIVDGDIVFRSTNIIYFNAEGKNYELLLEYRILDEDIKIEGLYIFDNVTKKEVMHLTESDIEQTILSAEGNPFNGEVVVLMNNVAFSFKEYTDYTDYTGSSIDIGNKDDESEGLTLNDFKK